MKKILTSLCILICWIQIIFAQIPEDQRRHKPYKRSHVKYRNRHHGNAEDFLLHRTKPVNILMILADDLGFGDTSVPPFTGSGIKTPNLQKMAERGVTLTNFHSASPTCTPSRSAILTGMYPWRMGIKSVFEYGTKQHNRDDWLIQVPTAANLFAAANYSTFHSGKWHLGGMRNDDYDMRRLPEKGPGAVGGKRCHHPGPNQQGFQNYVSVLDGPGAPRQNHLQVNNVLYSQGCNYLLHNDVPVENNKHNISGYLTYCEAKHAMRGMAESVQKNQPFYIHLWFHAPHGPWEEIPGYSQDYVDQANPGSPDRAVNCHEKNKPGTRQARFCNSGNRIVQREMTRFAKYRSMVADMDAQIGMVLRYLEELGIEKDTFVFFTSDNGAEDDSGGSGGLKGNKRYIYEGGIRVPAIAQWIDTIPAGGVVSNLAINTDLFPTFADAAGISIPSDKYRLDGMSILPELLHAPTPGKQFLTEVLPSKQRLNGLNNLNSGVEQLKEIATVLDKPKLNMANLDGAQAANLKPKRRDLLRRQSMLHERLLLWHSDYEGPKRTIGIFYDYKIVLDEQELPMEIFDLRHDVAETKNIILTSNLHQSPNFWKEFAAQVMNSSSNQPLVFKVPNSNSNKVYTIKTAADLPAKVEKSLLAHGSAKERSDLLVTFTLLYKLYAALYNYAKFGNNGYVAYMEKHPETRYPASPLSDFRPMMSNVFRLYNQNQINQIKNKLLHQMDCPVDSNKNYWTCSCNISTLENVHVLPFYADSVIVTNPYNRAKVPQAFLNSSVYLLDM